MLEWSERQAELLRRHPAVQRLSEQPGRANIVGEIELLGPERDLSMGGPFNPP